MDRQKFIEMMQADDNGIDPVYVEDTIDICLKRIYNETPDFESACKLSMCIMEESGELIEAMAHRMRSRTGDNYGILEEGADIILNVLCACKMFGASPEDLQEAVMVKCRRAKQKIDWDEG